MNLDEREAKFQTIYYQRIGMCGCGRPKEVKQLFYDLLENYRQARAEEITFEEMWKKTRTIIKNVDPDIIFEIIFHVFEHADLIGHSSSVYGSWFTEEGELFLKLLAEFKDEG